MALLLKSAVWIEVWLPREEGAVDRKVRQEMIEIIKDSDVHFDSNNSWTDWSIEKEGKYQSHFPSFELSNNYCHHKVYQDAKCASAIFVDWSMDCPKTCQCNLHPAHWTKLIARTFLNFHKLHTNCYSNSSLDAINTLSTHQNYILHPCFHWVSKLEENLTESRWIFKTYTCSG